MIKTMLEKTARVTMAVGLAIAFSAGAAAIHPEDAHAAHKTFNNAMNYKDYVKISEDTYYPWKIIEPKVSSYVAAVKALSTVADLNSVISGHILDKKTWFPVGLILDLEANIAKSNTTSAQKEYKKLKKRYKDHIFVDTISGKKIKSVKFHDRAKLKIVSKHYKVLKGGGQKLVSKSKPKYKTFVFPTPKEGVITY